jgi:hypothetical protein
MHKSLIQYTAIFTFNREKILNSKLAKASSNKLLGPVVRMGRDIARDGRRANIKFKRNDYKGSAKIIGRSMAVNAIPAAVAIGGQALPLVPTTPVAVGIRYGLNKVIPNV